MAVLGHDDAGQRHADLTVERALLLRDGCCGGGEVVVVEDDRGRLAAELERVARKPSAGRGGDLPTDVAGAGEGDLVDARVAHELVGHDAVAVDDVEHAGGKADLLGDLGEDPQLAGRLGRRLEHDGAAGEERRGDLVGGERQRGVPRDDRTDDADGLVDDGAERGELGGVLRRPRVGVGGSA